jgi:hypothetical protein
LESVGGKKEGKKRYKFDKFNKLIRPGRSSRWLNQVCVGPYILVIYIVLCDENSIKVLIGFSHQLILIYRIQICTEGSVELGDLCPRHFTKWYSFLGLRA